MKSKKVILGLAVIAILVIIGITLNMSSKDSSTKDSTASQSEPTTNTEITADSDTAETPEEGSNTDTAENPAANNNTDSSNPSTDTGNTNFSSADAATHILKFYLGEEDIESQHLTPISLEGNVAKKQDNSTTFYSNSSELTDDTTTGLLIILDNYNESAKTYSYTLKDYFSLKNGNDDSIGTGTVNSDGTVTETD